MAAYIKDKDAFLRLNFLYQASHCVLAQNPENVELARFYAHTQRTVSKRLVLRQDPSVKRTICKKCSSLLVPGVTATVRQRKVSQRQRVTVVRCLCCGLTKSFHRNPNYKLWAEQPEAQLENQSQTGNNAIGLRGNSLSLQYGSNWECVRARTRLNTP
uniref:Ribonuclease P/MRP subunit p21 n=1 Tax=Latimeria chalumnae TaxID=7897 RepID=H2ZWW6_LATCH